MPKLRFDDLWKNHPRTKGIAYPCQSDGKPHFPHQCAIRMGIALAESGLDLTHYPGQRCWHGHQRAHVLRAEEFAKWLKTQIHTIGVAALFKKTDANHFKGKRGIVFLLNFWGEGTQGDHLDLWDGNRLRDGELDYFSRATEVWFWPID